MSRFAIRPATVADAEGIARAHVQAWHESYRGMIPDEVLDGLSVEARTARWRSIIGSAARPIILLVAEDRDRIVGFGTASGRLSAELPTDGEVTALYLIEAAKRQGVGRALFGRLLGWFAEQNFHTAGLWVLTANTAARRFYEAMGGRADITRIDRRHNVPLEETAYVWDVLAALAGRSRS